LEDYQVVAIRHLWQTYSVHVFVDESGDSGMKLDGGSSRWLIIAACIFTTQESMESMSTAIQMCREDLGRRSAFEFKYAKTTRKAKDAFFSAIQDQDFVLRAILIDKRLLWSRHVTSSADNLHTFAITQLLTHTDGFIKDAKIVIDGKDTKTFEFRSSTVFRKQINAAAPDTVSRVVFADSYRNRLIQLADMCAGAIRRSQDESQGTARQHLAIISRHAKYPQGGLWYFK
jgi:hypothetical protein